MPTAERVNELLSKLPPRTGLPFSNTDHLQIAHVLQAILIECGIYEFHAVGQTLSRIGL